jgi:hypothetical protein
MPAASETNLQSGANMGERVILAPEQSPAPRPPAAPPTAVPTIPLPVPTATPQTGVAATTPAAGLQGDDGDLIEKEWVNKAKQIVERTRNDPYKQSKELTVFKADYMKKRYDKTIKVSQ